MKKVLLSILMTVFAVSIVMADGYQVGDKATDFNLMNVDGTMISMADMNESQGVILIFTCNHCPYSNCTKTGLLLLTKNTK